MNQEDVMKMDREAEETTMGQKWGSKRRLRGWRWKNGVIKLQLNGGGINNTGFDRLETVKGSIKVIKYHCKHHPVG